jgi:hypothetical protein
MSPTCLADWLCVGQRVICWRKRKDLPDDRLGSGLAYRRVVSAIPGLSPHLLSENGKPGIRDKAAAGQLEHCSIAVSTAACRRPI